MALIEGEAGSSAAGAAASEPARGWPLHANARTRASLGRRIGLALDAERPRWFTWVPVFFGAGIAAYFWLAWEPSLAAAGAMLVAAMVAWRVAPRGSVLAGLALAVVAAGLGFVLAKARTETTRAPVLERRLANVEVRGRVEMIEAKPKRGGRLTLAVTHIAGLSPEATPKRVRVRAMASLAALQPGDAIALRATLSPPAAPALPGAYDFARAAWFQRLGGVGYSMAAHRMDADAPPAPLGLRVAAAIERVREAIGARITAGLKGETGAIANAMITGERGGISEATNDAFRDSGLFHALSISGLHMAVMAGAIFWTLRLLLAAVPGLALRFPIKKWAAVGAALGALFYLLISGASPPTQRSYLMISIMFLAILLDRQALALRNIALSALLILLVSPESLLDLGFQMSYAAVAALVAAHEFISERLLRREAAAIKALDADTGAGVLERAGLGALQGLRRTALFFTGIAASTIIASLAVAPFAAYYFHKSQQYSILGNVLGLPICDLFIMPMALAVLVAMPFGLEAVPLWLMGLGVDALVWAARVVARLPGAVATLPAMPPAAFVLMVTGGIWLVLWGTRARLLGLAPIAAGLALAPLGTRPDIYVGQDGRAVAARIDGTRLSGLAARGRSFEMQRWLEHDGDARPLKDAARAEGWRCDGAGCTAHLKGVALAVTQAPSALADDCARARVLILTMPRPANCTGPEVVLDLWALRDHGTHTISIADPGTQGGIVVTSVASARGRRPWSLSGLGRAPASSGSDETRQRSRVAAFAGPPELAGRLRRYARADAPGAEAGRADTVRPEIEEEEAPEDRAEREQIERAERD